MEAVNWGNRRQTAAVQMVFNCYILRSYSVAMDPGIDNGKGGGVWTRPLPVYKVSLNQLS